MLMIQPGNNWPTDVGALRVRDYMVRADNGLYVSLAERRCSKHIIRHRKYAAPERGNVQMGLLLMLSKLYFPPLYGCFRGSRVLFCFVLFFVFLSFLKNQKLIFKFRARNLSY